MAVETLVFKQEVQPSFKAIKAGVLDFRSEISTTLAKVLYPEIEDWQSTDFETAAIAQSFALREQVSGDETVRRDLIHAVGGDINWNQLNKNLHAKAAIKMLGEVAGFGAEFLYDEGDPFRADSNLLRSAGKYLLKNLGEINRQNGAVLGKILSGEITVEQLTDITLTDIRNSEGFLAQLTQMFGNAALMVYENTPRPLQKSNQGKQQFPIPPNIGIPLVVGALFLSGIACSTQNQITDGAGTAVAEVQAVVDQELADLCQGTDASSNPACQSGYEPLNVGQPPSVEEAVQQMSEAYAAQGFNPETVGGKTAEWWIKWAPFITSKILMVIDEQTTSELAYYD